MKRNILFLTGLALALCGCHRGDDSIIGTWTVDKVNVQFDERRNTPELVRQIGEMEKQNTIIINSDSILTLTNADGSTTGRLHLIGDGTMHIDERMFGQWKDGQIVTRTGSPIGEVVVTYRKTNSKL
jgi:hypothetical protein